jgi:hypothetical protein
MPAEDLVIGVADDGTPVDPNMIDPGQTIKCISTLKTHKDRMGLLYDARSPRFEEYKDIRVLLSVLAFDGPTT